MGNTVGNLHAKRDCLLPEAKVKKSDLYCKLCRNSSFVSCFKSDNGFKRSSDPQMLRDNKEPSDLSARGIISLLVVATTDSVRTTLREARSRMHTTKKRLNDKEMC